MSPKGRHAKSQARISAYEKLLGQEVAKQEKELELFIPPGPRLGDVVIEANDVSKAYGDRLLYENLSVITSYSIHYTKLYEGRRKLRFS